jgi:hypothetical protein
MGGCINRMIAVLGYNGASALTDTHYCAYDRAQHPTKQKPHSARALERLQINDCARSDQRMLSDPTWGKILVVSAPASVCYVLTRNRDWSMNTALHRRWTRCQTNPDHM